MRYVDQDALKHFGAKRLAEIEAQAEATVQALIAAGKTRVSVRDGELAPHHVEELTKFMDAHMHPDFVVRVKREGFSTNGMGCPVDLLRMEVRAGDQGWCTLTFDVASTERAVRDADKRSAQMPLMCRGNAFGLAETLMRFDRAYRQGKLGEALLGDTGVYGLNLVSAGGPLVSAAMRSRDARERDWEF